MTNEELNIIIFTRIMNYISCNGTKGISIRDLEKANMSILKLSKTLNVPISELVLKDNWYIYNGEFYYYKKLYHAMRVINELLGEILSDYMGLPSVHYSLALDYNNIVGLLSKNFRIKGRKYAQASQIKPKYLQDFSEALESREITNLRKIIDKTLIRDFYSCLSDCLNNTLVSASLLKQYRLAESYDYEMSFIDSREDKEHILWGSDIEHEYDTYYNPLFIEGIINGKKEYKKITYDTLKSMLEYDEFLRSQLEKIMDFNMSESLEAIENTHGILIDDELKNYYKRFDRTRKEELRRIC